MFDFILGLIIGTIDGIVVMCLLQINKEDK